MCTRGSSGRREGLRSALLVLAGALGACATGGPSLRLERGASHDEHAPIALARVSFRGDDPAAGQVLEALSGKLEAALRARQVALQSDAALTLQPELITYEGPLSPFLNALRVVSSPLALGQTTQSCILWLRLIDRQGALVGEQLVSSDGGSDVLDVCAADAARVVAATPSSKAAGAPPRPATPLTAPGRQPSLRLGELEGFSGAGVQLGALELRRYLRDALIQGGTFAQVWTVPDHAADGELSAELVGERYFGNEMSAGFGHAASRRWSLLLIRYRLRSATGEPLWAETVLTQAIEPKDAQLQNATALAQKLSAFLGAGPASASNPK